MSTWTLGIQPVKRPMQSQREEKYRSPMMSSASPDGEAQMEQLGSFFLRKRFVNVTGIGGCFLHSAAVYKCLYTCGS